MTKIIKIEQLVIAIEVEQVLNIYEKSVNGIILIVG